MFSNCVLTLHYEKFPGDNMRLQKGFSLIELLIVVVIVGILAAIAMPNYQNYVIKGNRAAAQAFMMDVASREKQYLLDARTYTNSLATLGVAAPTEVSNNYAGCCTITVAAGPPPSFIITATPTSSRQASDGALTLSSDGTKTPAAKW